MTQAAHRAPPASGVTRSAVLLRDEQSLRSAHPPRKRSERERPPCVRRGNTSGLDS